MIAIDTKLAIEDALGASLLEPGVDEYYASLRRTGSENMVSVLAVQDREYNRRQGERNAGFIGSVIQCAGMTRLHYTTSERRGIATLDTIETVDDVEQPFEFSSPPEISDVGPETLEMPSALRAVAVWIDRDPNEVLETRARYYSRDTTRTKQRSVATPHMLIGHRLIENGKYAMVALTPFMTRVSGHGAINAVVSRPIVVRMTGAGFSRLMAIQDTLLGEGLSADEIEGIHDPKTGTLSIHPSVVSSVKGSLRRSIKGLALQRAPKHTRDLDEDFDMHLEDVGPDEVSSPEGFARYHVLEDTRRLLAMLGKGEKFDAAKRQLVENSYEDPSLKLLTTN